MTAFPERFSASISAIHGVVYSTYINATGRETGV
jgi:hypothetical protein